MSNPDKLIRLGDALAAAPHCCACDWADAIAALPAAQVAVKPLVWDVDDDGGFFAASVFGHWRVFSPRIGLWMWALYNRWPNPSVTLDEGGQLIANAYPSPEAAKAAVQADYEARIRAPLEVGPAPDVARLVEALREARTYVPDHHGHVTARIDAALAAFQEKTNG
jgi:hypothetical protein